MTPRTSPWLYSRAKEEHEQRYRGNSERECTVYLSESVWGLQVWFIHVSEIVCCVFYAMPKGDIFKDDEAGGDGQGNKKRTFQVFETTTSTFSNNLSRTWRWKLIWWSTWPLSWHSRYWTFSITRINTNDFITNICYKTSQDTVGFLCVEYGESVVSLAACEPGDGKREGCEPPGWKTIHTSQQ